jgi:hypothetical protein
MEKDISYINDSIKDEVNMYKTNYINKREKDIIKYLISRINNLTITYKNAVNIKDIKSYIFNEDDYVFLLSFT